MVGWEKTGLSGIFHWGLTIIYIIIKLLLVLKYWDSDAGKPVFEFVH